MADRKHRLVGCDPKWVTVGEGGPARGISFACPEGHDDCRHVIPFTPAIDGTPAVSWQGNGCIWQRSGDTFETLSLSPSIRREPVYASREAALAAGALAEYLTPSMFCALHIFIRDGRIEFCGDSR